MYVYYNPNPVGRTTAIDCSVRALSKVLHISWDDAYDQLSEAAKQMGDMPSNNAVFAAVMRKNGFFKERYNQNERNNESSGPLSKISRGDNKRFKFSNNIPSK